MFRDELHGTNKLFSGRTYKHMHSFRLPVASVLRSVHETYLEFFIDSLHSKIYIFH